MKFLILTLLISISTQQTIYSQLSCTIHNCSEIAKSCFSENQTECKNYGLQSMNECGANTIEELYNQITFGKQFDDPAAVTNTETCLLDKKDNDQFNYWARCLVDCASFILIENSFAGVQGALVDARGEEYTACFANQECIGNLSQLMQSDVCQKCSFFPEDLWNWNIPITYTDMQCFGECYSPNNTENTQLKALLEGNEDVINGIEFVDDSKPIEDNGHKKVFELIIAFILKIFAWFFK